MGIGIDELRKKLAQAEEEVLELTAAIRVLEKYSSDTGKDSAPGGSSSLSDSGTIDLADIKLPEAKKANKKTLADDIRDVITRLAGQEFSVNHICVILKNMAKKGSDSKHYRNRVYQAVTLMAKEGELVRTHKGVGSDPHLYKQSAGRNVSLVKGGPTKTGT